MEKKISRIAFSLLVLSLLIIIVNIPVNPFQEAHALQLVSLTLTAPNDTIPIVYNNWNAYVTKSFGTQVINIINASNDVLINSMNLSSTIGGSNKFISGIDCQNTGQLFHTSTISKGGTEYCVITATGGSGNDRVFLVDITNGVQGGNTLAGFSYSNNYMFGRCTLTGIPQIGGTVNCIYSDVNVNNHVFFDYLALNYTIVNGVPTTPQVGKSFTRTTHFDSGYTSGVAQPNAMTYQTLLSASTGFSTNEIGWTLHGGTQFALFNTGSIAQICVANTGTEAFGVFFGVVGGVNEWFVLLDNTIKVVRDGTCAVDNTLSLSTYDASATHIRGFALSQIRNEAYIYDDLGHLISMNLTASFPKIVQLNVGGDSTLQDGSRMIMAVSDNPSIGGAGQTDVGVSSSSTGKYFVQYWNVAGAPPSNPTPSTGACPNVNNPNCVGDTDCSTTQNANLAMCVLHNNPNNQPLKANSKFITDNVGGIICALGMANCTNTNIKTNGEGYIFELILIILTIALMLYASKMILNIPAYVWIITLLIDLAIGFALSWIDVTFFVLGAIAIVALSASKIKSLLYGEQF